MDKIADKIAALGIPGVVLLVAMELTGLAGGAALTTALATLGGPLGMLGGIALLIILALISKGITKYGFEALFKATIRKLKKRGISNEEIKEKVKTYRISNDLKNKILYYIDTFG